MKAFYFLFLCLVPLSSFSQSTNYSGNFNGSNAHVDLGTTVGNSGIRSIEFWFKPAVTINASTSATGWTFISRNDATQYREYGVYIRGTDWNSVGDVGYLHFFMRDNGVLHEIRSNSGTWTAATWYHVAGVIDPSTGMKLYIDGVLQNSTDAGTGAVQVDNTNASKVGTWDGLRYFQGEMEELRLWNRAISAAEIQAKMCMNLFPANENGLTAYWKFDEGSGTVLNDLTASAYNGNVSAMTWIVDSPCQAAGSYVMHYDGSGDYIDIGTAAGNAGIRSIEFWFRPDVTIDQNTTAAGSTFINRNDGTELHEYGVYIRGTDWSSVGNVGYLHFFMRDNGTLHEVRSNSNSWVGGTWYHVAGVIDPSAGMMLYIDGVLQTSTDPAGTIAVQTDNSNSTTFGTWDGIRFYQGRMDEMRFWDRALSQAEIQNKMCLNLNAANENGLTGYWKFNEGTGTMAYDSTAVADNGIVYNAIWMTDDFCAPEGTFEFQSASYTVLIYPNPSNGIFNISTDIPSAYIEIYNGLGELIISREAKGRETSIELDNYADGIYFVRISSGVKGEIVYSQKIFKQ
ncbi:MAG: T9SS type A sorting domain-containing protein [Bacteroidota bacterium]|nr:T9SS type A sorting domain-containing protein [Bacteroidota bacterium]